MGRGASIHSHRVSHSNSAPTQLREFAKLPSDSWLYNQPTESFDFSTFLNSSQTNGESSTTNGLSHLNLDTSASDLPTFPNPPARPDSSHSHRSSFSGSDYSYISTEIESDDPMSDAPEASRMQWTTQEVTDGTAESEWTALQGSTGYSTPGPSEKAMATMDGTALQGIGNGVEDRKRREKLEREFRFIFSLPTPLTRFDSLFAHSGLSHFLLSRIPTLPFTLITQISLLRCDVLLLTHRIGSQIAGPSTESLRRSTGPAVGRNTNNSPA